ncbi:MAG: hypothetical protein H6727_11260 [Myxococcales bacterium]|nr:hypothetical protein [Myxococcales bacterium]
MAKKTQKKVAKKKAVAKVAEVVEEVAVAEEEEIEEVEMEASEENEIESPVVDEVEEEEVEPLTPEEELALQNELAAQAALENVRTGMVESFFDGAEQTWKGLTQGMGPDVRVTLGLIGLMLGGVGLYYLVPSLAQLDFGSKARTLVWPLTKSVVIKSFLLGMWIYMSVHMVTEEA